MKVYNWLFFDLKIFFVKIGIFSFCFRDLRSKSKTNLYNLSTKIPYQKFII